MMHESQLSLDLDKRWRRRVQHWRRPDDRALFDPRGHSVDVVPHVIAREFICTHHYSGTMPSCTIAIGLFGPCAQLLGVAAFGVSASIPVMPKYCGPIAASSLELGRFVLLPDVAFNGETWFLARAFRLIAAEKSVRAVLSFADPVERRVGGLVVKPQHWGTIYQASNAMRVQGSLPRTLLVCPDGRPFSPRAMSKITSEERGCDYAARQLLDAGAPPRLAGESPTAWLARVREAPGFTRRRHPGNLAYVFGLDVESRGILREHHRETALPYPSRPAESVRPAVCLPISGPIALPGSPDIGLAPEARTEALTTS